MKKEITVTSTICQSKADHCWQSGSNDKCRETTTSVLSPLGTEWSLPTFLLYICKCLSLAHPKQGRKESNHTLSICSGSSFTKNNTQHVTYLQTLYEYSTAKHCNIRNTQPARKQVGRRKNTFRCNQPIYSSTRPGRPFSGYHRTQFSPNRGQFEVFCYLKFWLAIFAYSFVFMISTKNDEATLGLHHRITRPEENRERPHHLEAGRFTILAAADRRCDGATCVQPISPLACNKVEWSSPR